MDSDEASQGEECTAPKRMTLRQMALQARKQTAPPAMNAPPNGHDTPKETSKGKETNRAPQAVMPERRSLRKRDDSKGKEPKDVDVDSDVDIERNRNDSMKLNVNGNRKELQSDIIKKKNVSLLSSSLGLDDDEDDDDDDDDEDDESGDDEKTIHPKALEPRQSNRSRSIKKHKQSPEQLSYRDVKAAIFLDDDDEDDDEEDNIDDDSDTVRDNRENRRNGPTETNESEGSDIFQSDSYDTKARQCSSKPWVVDKSEKGQKITSHTKSQNSTATRPLETSTLARPRVNFLQPSGPTIPFPDPEQVAQDALKYPDSYSNHQGAILRIDTQNSLMAPQTLHHSGGIWGLSWSSDLRVLATCSTFGTVRLWDVEDNFSLLKELLDEEEENLEEFYVAKFTPSDRHLIVGGKLKDSKLWDVDDDDNKIIPAPLKIFDLETGSVINRLVGHEEEILCLKRIRYKDEPYLVSCGQDGLIFKWKMDETYTQLVERTLFIDPTSSIMMTLAFVPNSGNRYLLVAVDDGIRIYDFETAQKLQEFREIYSSYCDCAKFVNLHENILNPMNQVLCEFNGDLHERDSPMAPGDSSYDDVDGYYLLTRGVELLITEEGETTIDSNGREKVGEPTQRLKKPNSCHLMKLIPPRFAGEKFTMIMLKEYSHPQYYSNCWSLKLSSNGKHVLVPTVNGKTFMWEISTGKLAAVLNAHGECEVRDTLFHPLLKYMVTAGDDSCIKVFHQA